MSTVDGLWRRQGVRMNESTVGVLRTEMVQRTTFSYGEFYNVPRMIQFEHKGRWYFLRSEFVDERDDYSDWYDVYLLPFDTEDDANKAPLAWMNLTKQAFLGSIPIADIGLDESKRASIDAQAFDVWLSRRLGGSPR